MNPRFPHTCIISREQGDPQDGDTTTTLLFSGSCRRELNKFDTHHYANSSNTSQWTVSLPVVVKVAIGDNVSVDDGISDMKGVVADWATTNISHVNSDEVFQKDESGNVTSFYGTTSVGMHIYVQVTKN